MTPRYHVNRAWWDERAPAHAESPDYGFARYIADPHHLSSVVQFDRPRLPDLAGLEGVHLQCHIGTDTLSLARLGARMTGLDLSPASLAEARRLCAAAGPEVRYVEGDVYDAVDLLGAARFDFVFTGIGALNWLPDVRRWATVVAGLLRPGGRLFLRDGHPMLAAIDELVEGELVVRYPYFETGEPVVVPVDPGTYVTTDATFSVHETVEWNHGLGELITALLDVGMAITRFEEHRSVPWEALPGRMAYHDDGEWRLTSPSESECVPLSFTVHSCLVS